MSHFTSLNHIGFAVSDLDRSIRFYSDLLNEPPYFKEIYDVPYIGDLVGYPGAIQYAAFFRIPGQASVFLELIQYLNPVSQKVSMEAYNAGNSHLCLATSDLDAAYHHIGGKPRSENIVTSNYGVYEGARSMFFRDIDEITIQIVEIPEGMDPTGRNQDTSKVSL
jgi:catechol 2,3-dioxygenase-like lactoylglutathione lyase family enzyme